MSDCRRGGLMNRLQEGSCQRLCKRKVREGLEPLSGKKRSSQPWIGVSIFPLPPFSAFASEVERRLLSTVDLDRRPSIGRA